MRKKIIATFLALGMLATILPLTVQAEEETEPEVDLDVTNVSVTRISRLYYRFCYRLYNHGPDDIENADFWDAGGYKSGGKWYVHQDSWIHHTNFYLEANHYSPTYCWYGYMPGGFRWFCQCTDELKDVDETNEDNNCDVGFWYFF